MRKFLKYLFLTIILCTFLGLFALVNYATPSYNITYVKGIEVKRVDKDGPITKSNPADGPTRDVYYIYTQKPDQNEKVMVYRNEDTRWGFPFYFKFASADLQAKAQSFYTDNQLVQIKYYGWRLKILNEFPNAVSIKAATPEEKPSSPIFAYILYFILLIGLILSIQFVRGWYDSDKA